MKETKFSNTLSLYNFSNLSEVKEINHYISGRKGGFSQGELGELNMSFTVGDDPQNVIKNRELIAENMGVPYANLVIPKQTHTSSIAVVNQDNLSDTFVDTDALVTSTPGILISVMSADCIPVLICDPVQKVVAAIHAGWRGTMAGIVLKTTLLMQKEFNCKPSEMMAGIGPGICQKNYEVGEEVIQAVRDFYGTSEGLLKFSHNNSKANLDLWEANKRQLIMAGLSDASIEVAEVCTFSNPESFFSARRSAREGRFSAGILIRK